MILIKEPMEIQIRRAEAKGSGCFQRLYLGNLKTHRNAKRFSDSIDRVHKVYACFKTEDCLAKQKCFKECGEREREILWRPVPCSPVPDNKSKTDI